MVDRRIAEPAHLPGGPSVGFQFVVSGCSDEFPYLVIPILVLCVGGREAKGESDGGDSEQWGAVCATSGGCVTSASVGKCRQRRGADPLQSVVG